MLGSDDFDFDFSLLPARGRFEGIVTVWDCKAFEVESSFGMQHVLLIKGKCLDNGVKGKCLDNGVLVLICNVYAPCDLLSKQVGWMQLDKKIVDNIVVNWCVYGDFHAIRLESK